MLLTARYRLRNWIICASRRPFRLCSRRIMWACPWPWAETESDDVFQARRPCGPTPVAVPRLCLDGAARACLAAYTHAADPHRNHRPGRLDIPDGTGDDRYDGTAPKPALGTAHH